ncbi:hypothetical protein H0H92_004191 [Tricholoma furcatifolium]|nr:hypothetical protein H0H92_004191 [Tricholoma furcatifolium]
MPSFSSILRLTLAVVALHSTLTAALPIDNTGNAYSGNSNDTSGGEVVSTENKSLLGVLTGHLLRIGSGNGGCGGVSKSGPAIGSSPGLGLRHFGGGVSNSGNAYSGEAGPSKGGVVTGPDDSLIDLDSGNGGCGGGSFTGPAVGGAQGDYREDHPDNWREHGDDDRYDGGEGCDSC